MIARLLISASQNVRTNAIDKELKKNNLTRKHPDLLYFEQDCKLGIAEARKIKEHFSLKPYSAKGRIVVLENGASLTIEAQNALLKTIEELPKEAVLVLGATSNAALLPTILSRCEIVNLETAGNDALVYHSKFNQDLEKLLNSSIEERFAFIEKLKSKEEFLHFLVANFRAALLKSKSSLEIKNFLEELLQAEEWAKHNVNIRAILEYLILVMPPQK